MYGWNLLLGVLISIVIALIWSSAPLFPEESSSIAEKTVPMAIRVVPRVVQRYPHNSECFTQGLEFDQEGSLWESCGIVGKSVLMKTDLASGTVHFQRSIHRNLFAEGITFLNTSRILLLTWKDHIAFFFDPRNGLILNERQISLDGWGTCFDPDRRRLYVTDGTATLWEVHVDTLQPKRGTEVLITWNWENPEDSEPVSFLNELECFNGKVYANIWGSSNIAEIDPETGFVTRILDLSFLPDVEFSKKNPEAVLNGIAVDNDGRFYITGKLWENLYRIEF